MDLYLDDRLLHGRILHGWGGALRPRRYVLVTSTALAPASGEAYRAGAAARGADFAAASLSGGGLPEPEAGDFWLLDSLDTALRLIGRGFGCERLIVTGLRGGASAGDGDFALGAARRIQIARLQLDGVEVLLQAFPADEPLRRFPARPGKENRDRPWPS